MSAALTSGALPLLDLILPRTCLLTGEPLETDSAMRYLSESALELLHFANETACLTCGAPTYGVSVSPRQCAHCRELNPQFDCGRTVFLLGRHGRQIVHTLKYRGGQWLLPDIGRLAARVPGYLDALRGSCLVPVPLHPKRHRHRGFNQSLLLARTLAAQARGGTEVQSLLVRSRDTRTQTRLSREQRIENVQGAFVLAPGATPEPERRYVIIDDVFTTGATLNACACTLREEGIEKVDIATLAHG